MKNANINGSNFENETDIEKYLFKIGFKENIMNDSKYGYYLSYKYSDFDIKYFKYSGLKLYLKIYYNIDLFRLPDTAFIINDTLYIIEKKEQIMKGSIETKLWSGPSLKREYELLLNKYFKIEYLFILNDYLINCLNNNELKYNVLKHILKEHSIKYYDKNQNYLITIINEIINRNKQRFYMIDTYINNVFKIYIIFMILILLIIIIN